jgi:hypothetical protein
LSRSFHRHNKWKKYENICLLVPFVVCLVGWKNEKFMIRLIIREASESKLMHSQYSARHKSLFSQFHSSFSGKNFISGLALEGGVGEDVYRLVIRYAFPIQAQSENKD